LTSTALFAVLAAIGCGKQPADGPTAASGAVAVIDLDEVARRVGSDKRIADSITARQNALRQKLVELARSYNQQIDERRKSLPANEAGDGGVTLAAWQQQANASLNQVKQQAEQELANHRGRLVDEFRTQVKPAARRVAQRRGLSMIVTKNDSFVFDYASACDITNEVADELLAGAEAPAQATTASLTPGTTPALMAQGELSAAAPRSATTGDQAARPASLQR
jgi:Skp family chaperone for outer membrane proteins